MESHFIKFIERKKHESKSTKIVCISEGVAMIKYMMMKTIITNLHWTKIQDIDRYIYRRLTI